MKYETIGIIVLILLATILPCYGMQQYNKDEFYNSMNSINYLNKTLQLNNLQLYSQSGEIKYSGIREMQHTKKEIEGTLISDLKGININPDTLQLYYGNYGDKCILYLEGSRNI
jgi:hypothetical protein